MRRLAVVPISFVLARCFSVSIVQGNLPPFPPAAIVLALVAAAGIIPMRERPDAR
jgi:hypothetical protein